MYGPLQKRDDVALDDKEYLDLKKYPVCDVKECIRIKELGGKG